MDQIKTILSLLIVFLSTQASAHIITLRADIWCPYACDPKADLQGFMVDIAREIFKKNGHSIDYQVTNWARAVEEVKVGKFDVLVGANSTSAQGFEFPSIPNAQNSNYFWTLKSDDWFFHEESYLKDKKFGIVNGYSYGSFHDDLIKKKHPSYQNVAGQMPLKRMIQMVESKRLDGFVENPYVFFEYLKHLKKSPDIFRQASVDITDQPDLFLAFSPANIKSRVYAKMMDEGMVELRRTGRLNIILDRYGLSDWKK